MKQKCRNCALWHKVHGTIRKKNEFGLCDFLMKRIHIVWKDDDLPPDPKNKSIQINFSAEISGNIGPLEVSSTSKELLVRHGWIWTDAGFYCSSFIPKTE